MKRINFTFLRQPSALVKNASWLLSIEGIAKISRVVTILCMAGFLTPIEYGVAILAVAFHDLFRMLMRSGTGNQVIQCPEEQLPSYTRNAAALQWLFCTAIAVMQFSVAPILADIYAKPELTPLLQLMSLSYLLYPWVSIRVYLLHRANNMKYYSLSNGCCIIAENLSIAVMLWAGFGIVAVAVSKIIFSALWLILFLRVPDGGYGIAWQPKIIKKLLGNSTYIVAAELAKAGRHHADTFIAGRILTPEWFGIYAFAKNAGVGLSQSLINAYNGALFPYLSELNRNPQDVSSKRTIWLLAAVLTSLFILQAALVPVYVPLLFNESWQSATIIVSVLCLTAIPNLYLDTYCCFLRASGAFSKEFLVRLANLFACVLLLLFVPISSPMEVAKVVALASAIWLVPAGISYSYQFLKYPTEIFSQRSK